MNVARLARAGGSWRGAVHAAAFERLGGLLVGDEVRVSLDFGVDHEGRARVTGKCALTAYVCCGGCSETLAVDIDADIDFRVVGREDDADALMPTVDVVVCDARSVTVSDLIEDDLLLNVPSVACVDRSKCPHATELREFLDQPEGRSTANPFGVLEDWKPGGTTAR
ncbi:MAG: hypothetical protein J4F45_08170 [Pseudomonadales bacterium]|nr:hypothetical protein [Pseudomonadales bacterium]